MKKSPFLFEIAWEVCNQVGGIYTVIRSKAGQTVSKWNEDYCLIGPYLNKNILVEFEKAHDWEDPIGKVLQRMQKYGIDIMYGRWLVTGRPKVILFNPSSIYHDLGGIKYRLWENHHIATPSNDGLLDQVLGFGEIVKIFFKEYAALYGDEHSKIIAHFHEWMAGAAIPEMRRENINASIVFTTHATLLGRYLAMNDDHFYDHLPFMNWENEAKHFNIEAPVKIERACAHGSHVFTTVSDVTGRECTQLLGRTPDLILPNGLNIERFTAMHEFQNLHQEYKNRIHQFVMGHFFPSYFFDLDKTLYFFTSGRYEYKNKGFDIVTEALARLNWRMEQEKIDMTVVMFYVTKRPYYCINPRAMQSRGLLGQLREICDNIQKQVGEKLFYNAARISDQKLPNLNEYVTDYLHLKLQRTLQTWKTSELPIVITHTLIKDSNDELLSFIRQTGLINHAHHKVKMVYHPDFISSTSPLFQMDYDHFVRGCHLGIFPSYYEPWGYTPLECVARGVPAVTSDLSGFGDYVRKNLPEVKNEVFVVNRSTQDFNAAAEELANYLLNFVKMNRRERIAQRNRVEGLSVKFDWEELRAYYDRAYEMAARIK